MFSKKMSRIGKAALILMLCVAPVLAQAGVRLGERGKSKPAASRVHSGEGVVLTLWHGLVGLFEKEGASIDPSGQHGTGTGSGAGTNNGASIDPPGSPQG
ncbi:MAG TPA: hypothetical protein VGS07_05090 [Thermoanaerobaculia bacterium]|jgi:hypothetical protein|nr:hypothetical protein [Thermoanaerobaculia bacterium]